MRTLAALTILVAPALAGATPCTWDDTEAPELRGWDRVVLLQRAFTCPADAEGTLRVELSDHTGALLGEESKEVRASGKWPRSLKVSALLLTLRFTCDDGTKTSPKS